jgi:DNA-binding XRE family transcriptional regulator
VINPESELTTVATLATVVYRIAAMVVVTQVDCGGAMTRELMNEFRQVRKLAGVSQQELEAKTKINRAKLSGFENGHLELTPHELASVADTVLSALQAKADTLQAMVTAMWEVQ